MDVQDSADEILETQLCARLVASKPKSKHLYLTGQIPALRLLKKQPHVKVSPRQSYLVHFMINLLVFFPLKHALSKLLGFFLNRISSTLSHAVCEECRPKVQSRLSSYVRIVVCQSGGVLLPVV